MEEGFNYRSADRLMQVSKSARKLGKPALEEAMSKGPEAVAEAMYGGRMGNTEKGDAYKFRGRGYIQLTGKGMYKEAGDAIGVDLANNPDLAASPEVAAKVATWYWQKQKRAGDTAGSAARRGDVKKTTEIINGGLNGLEDRERLFGAYKTEIASAGNSGKRQKPNASSMPPTSRMPSPVATAAPTVSTIWLLLCTLTAGWQKVFADNPKIGFLAHAHKYQTALDKGEVLAPAKSLAQMQQVVFNDYVDATLAFGFILLVVSIVLFGARACWQAWQSQQPTARETPFTPLPAKA